MSLPPRTRLEHYEILSPIGKSGMGEVYRARDTRLGREVAIKTLPADLSRGDEHLARFKREARTALALNHPHICTICDLYEHGGTPFIVMELLKGDTLSDLLVRGPLVLERALDLGMQLADALEAGHAELQAVTRERHSTAEPPRPAHATVGDRTSIVVLPFENLSADPDNEYFSDGLTDEIITDLSQIRMLRVISRNSSMQLKGAGKDLKALASELGVRYVVSGSVRTSGSAVRITAQLVDPIKDEILWAEKYSGTLEDVFEIHVVAA